MKLSSITSLLFIWSIGATSLPTKVQTIETNIDLIKRYSSDTRYPDLEKRRGGGGVRGGSGSSGGSSGGRSGSSSGSSSGRSSGSSSGHTGSSSGHTGSSSGRTGSSSGSSSGSSGSTRGGSSGSSSTVSTPKYGGGRYEDNYLGSTKPKFRNGIFGGGKSGGYQPIQPNSHSGNRYYAGGSTSSYRSGSKSPLGLTPILLPIAAFSFFHSLSLYSVYSYPYNHPYYYYNDTTHHNQSYPVTCLCEEYQECGCDDNNNSTYYDSLFNGTKPQNTSSVRVVDVDGTDKIYINGTLPNGTDTSSTSSGVPSTLLNASGYWPTVVVVCAAVWGL